MKAYIRQYKDTMARSVTLALLLAVTLSNPSWGRVVTQQTSARSTRELPKGLPLQAALFALCRPQLPDPAVLRRHPSAHVVLDGRRALRRAARAERRLSLRQGRGDHGLGGPAGEALAAARFPRGRRPFRQHGLLSRICSPASPKMLADPTGRTMVRHDPVGQGRRRGDRDHRRLLARHLPDGARVCFPERRPTARRGRRRSRPPRRPTIRAGSPPSSATSGPRTPAATICTATSSSATTAERRARSSRSRP